MLRRLTDMPAGTIGFEAIGDVEDDDWEDTIEPVLRQEIAEGRNLRRLLTPAVIRAPRIGTDSVSPVRP